MKKIFGKSRLWLNKPQPYCPGCGHGLVHRIVCELLEEMGLADNCVFMAPVGCSILAYSFLDLDVCQPAHGRTPAAATGVKRARPDTFVVCYQGDGDLASIGAAEILHACNRGENITVIFVNNAIYGMTGGQMAPTTLIGMPTATSPYGRQAALHGYPLKITELIAQLPGVAYVTRQSVHTPAAVRKAKKAIKKGFENQARKIGTSFIEIVSTCSSGWKISPVESNRWMEEHMFKFYPLGDLKDAEKDNEEDYRKFIE
ncbi:MAG TPA: 2-oxoglutarate oxidoreductase [Marinilabiliales bacterium]|nr:2-oxoglutarate oxidoreductase [Marinilabiliales bacterium]